jgi:Holliday junction resolvase RusA-like endonuclease
VSIPLPLPVDENVRFEVLGTPQPAGSKRPFQRKDGSLGVRDANDNAREWKNLVADKAAETMRGQPPLEGPLAMLVTFYLRRPKSHYGSGRNAGRLKASAPFYPSTRPDTLKLTRAIEDALTGVVYRDDAQIAMQLAIRRYGDRPRVTIVVGGI